ncbi:hypothetical protein OEZ85_009079 [Tetradesmus obliquus]|uniref:Uncharacterized protein n=1 Tax=Tetradesmus obliquus TaxID=3088 RepID=A0ABY8TLA7_TETOB|nr:hypothetical protein OEZ85_009079 [Tetradesmus obliquus]
MATYPAHYNSRRNKAIRQFLGFTDRNTRVTREYALQRGFPTVKALKDHAHGLLQGFPEDLWLDAHRRGEFDETPQRIRNDAARRARLQQQAATPASKRLWPRRTDLVVHGRRSLPDGSLVPRLRKQVQASGTVKLKLSWKQQKAGAVARTSTQEVPFVVTGQLSKIKRLAQEYAKQLQQNELSQSPVISVDIDAVDIASVHVMQTNVPADLADVRMTNFKHFQLDGVPMTYYDRGQGTCVFDALKYLYTKQYPKCGLQTYFKDEANFWSDIKAAHLKRTSDSCYDPVKQGVATADLCEGFCKPHSISIYATDSKGECFFFHHPSTRCGSRPPLCYRVMGNHCYPDPVLGKSLSQVRSDYTNKSLASSSFKAGNQTRGDDRLSRIAAGKLVHVEDVSGIDHLKNLMTKTGTVPDGRRISLFNNKIVSYELGGVTYVFGEKMDLVSDTYQAMGKEWAGQTFSALLWDLVEDVYGTNGLPKGRPNPEDSMQRAHAFVDSSSDIYWRHVKKHAVLGDLESGPRQELVNDYYLYSFIATTPLAEVWSTYAHIRDSNQWEEALDIVQKHGRVLIEGGPGMGKTWMALKIGEALRKQGLRVVDMAYTNMAALNIGGQTMDRALGLRRKEADSEEDPDPTHYGLKWIKAMAKRTDALLADEVSLPPAHYWDRVNRMLNIELKPADSLHLPALPVPPKEGGGDEMWVHPGLPLQSIKTLKKDCWSGACEDKPFLARNERFEVGQVSGDNEFDAAAFRAFNESKGITLINHVSKYVHNPGVQGGNSLGVIDSFARSIKHMVRTYALSHNNPRWGEYLQDVLGVYNESPHAGLKMMTPDWVFLHPDSMWHDMVAKVELNKRVNAALEASDYHTEDEVRAIMGTRRVHKVKLAGKLALGDMVMVLKDKASQFAKGPRRNLDRIFVVAELMPRLRYRVAEYADLLAKGLSPASDDWIAQVDLLDRVYARPELYKLSPEDLPEDGADLGLSVEEYQQAREHLREQLEEEGELDDPEDRDFVAVKEEPDEEEIDEARGDTGKTRRRDRGRDESLQEFPEAYSGLWSSMMQKSSRDMSLPVHS